MCLCACESLLIMCQVSRFYKTNHDDLIGTKGGVVWLRGITQEVTNNHIDDCE